MLPYFHVSSNVLFLPSTLVLYFCYHCNSLDYFYSDYQSSTKATMETKHIIKTAHMNTLSARLDCITSGFFLQELNLLLLKSGYSVVFRSILLMLPRHQQQCYLIWSIKSFLIFHEEGLKMHSSIPLWAMIENANISLCFLKYIPPDKEYLFP